MTSTGTQSVPVMAGPEPTQGTACLAVCIATYKRPHLLTALLAGLDQLAIPDGYHLEFRIVDNDALGSARETVQAFAKRTDKSVRYAVQPERNIALARNLALDAGPAELLAFLDDDEVPASNWLIELTQALGTDLDLVIGDVIPDYATRPPRWVQRGRFHHKSAGATGQRIPWRSTRTSNTLLRGNWIYQRGLRFDARFGRSGAEDTELFKRMHEAGGKFAAAPDAIVTEHVHQEQCRVRWLMRRFWQNGVNYERLFGRGTGRHPLLRCAGRTVRGCTQLLLTLPLTLFGRKELCVRALLDLARAGGGLVGWLGHGNLKHSRGYRSSGCEQ